MVDYWIHKTISTSRPAYCFDEELIMSQQLSQQHVLDRDPAVPTAVMAGGFTVVQSTVTTDEEYLRRLTDCVRRLAKESVFCGMQFVFHEQVLDVGELYYNRVMIKAGATLTDPGIVKYWNSVGKKVVEKTINRQRQAVMLRVKKQFAGKSGVEDWNENSIAS